VFASAAARIVVEPSPLAALARWSHGSSVLAVHLHPASVWTSNDATPPLAETAALAGETTNLQGAASCATVIGEPFTSIVPRRGAGTAFGSTRKAMLPLP
jgi:hypothetical protein